MKARVIVVFLALSAIAAASPPKPTLRPLADEAIGTISGVLRTAQSCAKVDELQRALWPQVYLLAHLDGADADRALAKLQWYRMASGEEYDCIVIERGVRRPGYVDALKSMYDDCRVQLGKESKLCFSPAEMTAWRNRVLAAIEKRAMCGHH